MVYLILCGLCLLMEVLCFIFLMLPLVTVEIYSSWFNLLYSGNVSIFDYLSDSDGLLTFISAIIAIITLIAVVICSIRVYLKKEKNVKIPFILSIVLLCVLVLQLIFFTHLKKDTSYEVGEATNGRYYIREQTPLIKTIFIMYIINVVIAAAMVFFSGMFSFSLKLKDKRIFNLVRKEKILNNADKTESENIEKKEKIQIDDIEKLVRLNELKKEGIITEEEFEDKKKELL